MKALYRYIPSPVYEKLKSLNLPPNQLQKLICLIHLIYVPSIYKNKRDEHMKNGYAEITSDFLKNIDRNYSTLIAILEHNKIIEFISGKIDRTVNKFRLNPSFMDYVNPFGCRVEIADIDLKTKIIRRYNKFNVTKKAAHIKAMEAHFRSSFRIQVDDCIQIIDDWYQNMIKDNNSVDEIIFYNNKYIAYKYPLLQMKDGLYYYKRNLTNFRIDTNLTNLGKVFKEFIIDADDLIQIDISNSQPFFISCIFKAIRDGNRKYTKYFTEEGRKRIRDINRFEFDKFTLEAANGKFYECLMKLAKIDSRDDAKDAAYAVMFSKNNTNERMKKIFKSSFPTISDAIEFLKNFHIEISTNKDGHARFAILLQRVEAKIFIDNICRQLTDRGIGVYTIHDSVLVKKVFADDVQSIIQSVFTDEFGIAPNTKTDLFGFKKQSLQEMLYEIKYEQGKVLKMLKENNYDVFNLNGVYHVHTDIGTFNITENQSLRYPDGKHYNHYNLGAINKILNIATSGLK